LTTREEVRGFEKKQQIYTKYKRIMHSQAFFAIAKKYATDSQPIVKCKKLTVEMKMLRNFCTL